MVQQHHLWQDGYVILQVETGVIGKNRLARYLQWLDKTGNDWSKPDLDAFGAYLRSETRLQQSTIYQTLVELRNHYVTILANPENYPHVAPADHEGFVNTILGYLGYNIASVNYQNLMTGEQPASHNMLALLPTNTVQHRDTQLVGYITWLDKHNRHWSQPDLLAYKAYLLEETDFSREAINNAITTVRKRYYEIIEDGTRLATIPEDQREDLLNNLRDYLGYLDRFPNKQNANRDMLEDDPFNQNWLKPEQVAELLSKPDKESLTGLRDYALLSLALATGVQPFEIANVEIAHLRQSYEGALALYIPSSKQREERLVPYDDVTILEWVDRWLTIANITEGHVFRGTYGNRDVLRPHKIAPETASDILSRYPVTMHRHLVPLIFSDLRATCGRRWYDAGLEIDEIERRLGIQYRRATLTLLGLRVKAVFG